MPRILITVMLLLILLPSSAEDGYRLWLRYDKIKNEALLQQYKRAIKSINFPSSSPTLLAAKNELLAGLEGLLGQKIPEVDGDKITEGSLMVFSRPSPGMPNSDTLGNEGFFIHTATINSKKNVTVITANTDIGVLYGVFHYLRLLQTNQQVTKLNITNIPKIKNRILNHWDNLNRHVERGYAGISIWNWHMLPGYIDQRYIDYARANASLGINGTVLTNVNANALVLTAPYLEKVAALANVFRPYGLKVYLTARFSAPIEIGALKTADPNDTQVQQWWKDKAAEIYKLIPDFGGFLVKANSEGQPGPQNYGRTHADGANMLADAVAPNGGIVMWRAFVYSNESPEDRFKQAYNEFKPLDGKFRSNVLVQVKNGPIDFQPREPFSPLFGAMPQTPLVMEFQITQEYLGQATNLVYEAPMFKETLDADTYANGKGSTIAKVIDGSVHPYKNTGIAGVSNIGNDRNWTGHPFGQANWYAYGRLAWDPGLSSAAIADEWIRQTFGNNEQTISTIKKIMLASHEAMVNYMTPLGLHHIMGTGHHYGPAPWVSNVGRADWNPVYYHRADSIGVGFDRTATGSNALSQYAPEVRRIYENMKTCPEEYLLWFHHVPWTFKMKSGRTLWDELC
ncbi:MAG TPA: alpha-glucuronidase family glycosyl hydrolase, partial [Chitinophagaceae bacterium]